MASRGMNPEISRAALARLAVAAVWTVGIVVGNGCGVPRQPLTMVQGKVVFNGAPLKYGNVIMIPSDDSRRGEARSRVDDTGHFTMVHDLFRDTVGVPPGRYRMAVTAFRPADDGSMRPVRVLPEKFADPNTSDLEVTVAEGTPVTSLTIFLNASGPSATPQGSLSVSE